MLEFPLPEELSEGCFSREFILGFILGREQGFILGREQGFILGREQGFILGLGGGLITMLKARFDDFTPELEREIRAVRSRERLYHLIRVAATCGNLAEFERVFQA